MKLIRTLTVTIVSCFFLPPFTNIMAQDTENKVEQIKSLCKTNLDNQRFGIKRPKENSRTHLSGKSNPNIRKLELDKKIKLNPNNPSAYADRAVLKFKNKDYNSALSDINISIKIAPNQEIYYKFRADIKVKLKKIKEALADLDRAIKIKPDEDAYLSRFYMNRDTLKDYKRALVDLDRVIQLKPNNSGYYYDRASLKRYELEDLLGALSDIDIAIEIEPYRSSYYESRSGINKELENYDSALIDLNKAIEFGKGTTYYSSFYRSRAHLKQFFLDDNQGALEDKQKVNQVYEPYILAPVSTLFERTEIEKDVYLKLLPKYDLAILKEPYNADNYIQRAKLKVYYLDDIEGGFADFNKAIEIEPNNASHYEARAMIKEYDFKDIDSALADYNKAIQLDPNNSFIYVTRACFRQNNSLDNVMILSDFNKAIQLDPNRLFVYKYRAEFKENNLGDKQGAINDLRQKNILELEIWNRRYIW